GDEREQDMLPEDNVEAASEAALPGVTIDAVLYFASGGCHGSSVRLSERAGGSDQGLSSQKDPNSHAERYGLASTKTCLSVWLRGVSVRGAMVI
ncbi:hypothetical protein LTR60_007590, partial [Cryomyces antarcticus]